MEENKKIEEKEVSSTPEAPKKKSKGCLTGCLITLGILLILAVGLSVAGYFGYKKIKKSMDIKDLGIEYSQEDYYNLMENIGLDADPTMLCIDCPTPTFSNPHELSVIVTDEQASAAFEYINDHLTVGSVSDTQIDIKDGNAILTTNFSFQGKKFPIYMVGSVSRATDTSLSGNISELKAGALNVPESITSLVESTLLNLANEKLASTNDTVRIDRLELKESGVLFEGLLPQNAE